MEESKLQISLHVLHRSPISSSPHWLVLACAISIPSLAQQQSYRSYQQLSGRVLRQTGQSQQRPSFDRSMPMRFQGWKYAERFGPDYLKRFSRPRESTRRAERLASTARSAAHFNSAAAQTAPFGPSALPGLLLRDSLPAGYIPTSVGTGDFNRDGKMDFVVANGGDNTLWLYFGRGDGTFSLPIIMPITQGQSPVWVATADLRGSGKTDLIVAEADSNSIGIFLGKGDGTFTESKVALPASAVTLAIGDFNHDGNLDIAVPINDSNSPDYIVTLPGKGDGTFGSPVVTLASLYAPETFWVSSADMNGDGIPDLVLSNDSVPEISAQVFLSNGDGTFSAGQAFEAPFGGSLESTAIFDGDEDGKPDIVATDSFSALWFFHGNGDGTFSANPTRSSTGDVSYGIGVADLSGDGHLDVVTSGVFVGEQAGYGADPGNLTCVLFGDGKGNFVPANVYVGDLSAFSLAIADFNGDGHPDIVTANQDSDSAVLFTNDGHGGFGEPRGSWIGLDVGPINSPLSNMMAVDVDGNGKPDVVFMEWNVPPDPNFQLTVLLNQGAGNLSAPIRSDATPFVFGDFVLADFRGTGLPDFLSIGEDASAEGGSSLSFAPNQGGGHFGTPTSTTPAGAQGVLGVGDLNGDGKLDFVAATGGVGATGQLIQVTSFLGNGDGTFRTGPSQTFGNTKQYPAAVYVGDFNEDGKLDLLVFLEANGGFTQAQVYELFGKGDGSFQPAQLLFSNFNPMIVADVNHDGRPDIIESAFSMAFDGSLVPATFTVYLGQPDGSFTLSQTYTPYVDGSLIPQPGYPTSAGQHFAPMIGDFNGDGNLDIAAFQSAPTTPNRTLFVQFLLGNGDGTFTPSYSTFFFPSNFPTLAVDVDGDGRDDLVELNGFTSSYDVIPMIAGPSFQFELAGDPVAGSTGSGLVVLAIPAASSTTITLSASDPAITVPPTVTVPAGQLSQLFTFSIGAAFNPNHVFALTAQLDSQTAIAYGTQVSPGAKGFAVAPLFDPLQDKQVSMVNLAAGQTSPSYVSGVSSLNGYGGTLSLGCLGLPSQAQCEIAPSVVQLPPGEANQFRVVITVPLGETQGSYPFKLRATDGALNNDLHLTLNVGDFTMSLSPTVQQAFPTDAAKFAVLLTSVFNYHGLVDLTCSGLPAGASCPSPLISSPLPGGFSFPFEITTTSVPTGNYPFTMTGVSSPLVHTASATLQVWDFNPSVAPLSATVNAGGSATFNLTVASANGFDGNVTFGCETSSGLISCTFNPVSTTVPPNGNATSSLTLTASSQLGSAHGRSSWIFPAAVLMLPVGAFFLSSRRKLVAVLLVLLGLSWTPSCGGGGSGGGGGGGGGGTAYTINVLVSSGNSTKTAGTIKLTVN